MLKRWSIVVIVLALVALMAIPASAAPAEKTSFIVAECAQPGNPQSVERFEFPNPGRVLVRGAHNVYDEYVLEGSVWTMVGVNNTVANIDATFPEFVGSAWGTFHYSDDGTVGEFFGTWSWGSSASGHASGKSADGRLLKVTLGIDPSPYPPIGDCLVNEYMVIDPHA